MSTYPPPTDDTGRRRDGRRRVAVTGIGAVTALGPTFPESWRHLLAGRSTARPIARFDASAFPTTFAYEVGPFALTAAALSAASGRGLSRSCGFAINATLECLHQAGLESLARFGRRAGVCLGIGMGTPDLGWFAQTMANPEAAGDPFAVETQMPATVTRVLTRLCGAGGGSATIHTACASSAQALGEAFEQIVLGERDVMLTGGADAMIEPFQLVGFSLLGALSRRNDAPAHACRPFALGRDGFVLGEGACILLLEEWEHARARGAVILAEMLGYGESASAFRITDLEPDGLGPERAMRQALADAGVDAADVGYVNAHGTGTLLNDRVESAVISRVLGSATPTSSTKSMTGHLIAAAGAVEAAFCVQALRDQVLPPSINVDEQDPECRVRLTGPTATPAPLRYALSNSNGFGGSNSCLIFGTGATQTAC